MNESSRSKSWSSHAAALATLSVGTAVLAFVVLMDGLPATHDAGGAAAVTSRVATGPAAYGDTSMPAADEALRGRDTRGGSSPEEVAPTF